MTMQNWQDHITSEPDVMFGKPCFKGTRIPVELILEKIALGRPIDEILDGYPKLNKASIQAAQFYALDAVRNDILFPEA
jgi:uncharacterized protein (DUF433 family)